MKQKTRITILLSIAFYALSSHIEAQELEIQKRFPIIKNDTIAGYFFLYKDAKADRESDKYIFTRYNYDFTQTETMEVMVEKKYTCGLLNTTTFGQMISKVELINNTVLISFYTPKTGLPVKHKVMVLDLAAKKVLADSIVEIKPEEVEQHEWRLLSDKTVIKIFNPGGKGVAAIDVLDLKLKPVFSAALSDDIHPKTRIDKKWFLDNNTAVLETFKHGGPKVKSGVYNYDLWFVSGENPGIECKLPFNADGDTAFYTLNSVSKLNAKEYALSGAFYPVRNNKPVITNEAGIFITKIDLSNPKKPLVITNHFSDRAFNKNINNPPTVPPTENKSLINKIWINNGKTYVLFEVVKKQTFGMIGVGMFGNKSNGSPIPDIKEELTALNLLKNCLYIVELDSKLKPVNSTLISTQKEVESMNYGKDDAFYHYTDAYFNKVSQDLIITSTVESSKKTKVNTEKIVYMLYKDGQPLKTDEMELPKKALWTEFYPVKPGYIMLLEYYEKEKKLEKRVEKLNISE